MKQQGAKNKIEDSLENPKVKERERGEKHGIGGK